MNCPGPLHRMAMGFVAAVYSSLLVGCHQTPGELTGVAADHPVYAQLDDGVYATNKTCCSDQPVRAILILHDGQYKIFVRSDEQQPDSDLVMRTGTYAAQSRQANAPHLLMCDHENPAVDRFTLMLVRHPNEFGWSIYHAARYVQAGFDPDDPLYEADRLTFITGDELEEWLALSTDELLPRLADF